MRPTSCNRFTHLGVSQPGRLLGETHSQIWKGSQNPCSRQWEFPQKVSGVPIPKAPQSHAGQKVALLQVPMGWKVLSAGSFLVGAPLYSLQQQPKTQKRFKRHPSTSKAIGAPHVCKIFKPDLGFVESGLVRIPWVRPCCFQFCWLSTAVHALLMVTDFASDAPNQDGPSSHV